MSLQERALIARSRLVERIVDKRSLAAKEFFEVLDAQDPNHAMIIDTRLIQKKHNVTLHDLIETLRAEQSVFRFEEADDEHSIIVMFDREK